MRAVIIGGGIAGLTTALDLKDRAAELPDGLEMVVLEAGERVGGNIRTDHVNGFTVEWGPNGYLDNAPATRALIRRLGLEEKVQKGHELAARRFLFRDGRLHELPTGPIGFLKSPILSLRGRLRVLLEPFARSKPEEIEETIYDFASRRIGHEAASILIDAMVSGVFAGNIHELSLESTFPKTVAMEAEHGSLVKALLAKMAERRSAKKRVKKLRARGENTEELTQPGGPARPAGTITSFRAGLQVLGERLAEELGPSVWVRHRVSLIEVDGRHAKGEAHEEPRPWRIEVADRAPVTADAVVLAAPAPKAGPLLQSVDPVLSEAVRTITGAGLAVVALGYNAEEIGGAPQGFGFLVPRGEGPRILGCLWDSSIFPGRAPDGRVLLRAMVGGAHDPEAVQLGDRDLLRIVRTDLEETMGLRSEPILIRIYRHPLGIAQYVLGHQQRLDRIHSRLRKLPGLWVAGSSYYGNSINACIEKAGEQVKEILAFLKPTPAGYE